MKSTEELLYLISEKNYYVEVQPLKNRSGIALCAFEESSDGVMRFDVSADTMQEALVRVWKIVKDRKPGPQDYYSAPVATTLTDKCFTIYSF